MYTAGLNSASIEFTQFYMTLFWGELILLGVFTGVWYGLMVRRGREVVTQPMSNREEVRRLAVLWGLVGVTSLNQVRFYVNKGEKPVVQVVRQESRTPTERLFR